MAMYYKGMNKLYIQKVQDLIGQELANKNNISTQQIKDLLRISGELEILKEDVY